MIPNQGMLRGDLVAHADAKAVITLVPRPLACSGRYESQNLEIRWAARKEQSV